MAGCRHALPDTRDQAQPKCNHETERQCQWAVGWEPEVLTAHSVWEPRNGGHGDHAGGGVGTWAHHRHLPLPRALDTGDRSFLFRCMAGGRGVCPVMGPTQCQYHHTACSYPYPIIHGPELMQCLRPLMVLGGQLLQEKSRQLILIIMFWQSLIHDQ